MKIFSGFKTSLGASCSDFSLGQRDGPRHWWGVFNLEVGQADFSVTDPRF